MFTILYQSGLGWRTDLTLRLRVFIWRMLVSDFMRLNSVELQMSEVNRLKNIYLVSHKLSSIYLISNHFRYFMAIFCFIEQVLDILTMLFLTKSKCIVSLLRFFKKS